MNEVRPLPGSFRDPNGSVYDVGGRIIRSVADGFAAEFDAVKSTGLLEELVAREALLPFEQIANDALRTTLTDVRYLIEVPRLHFVSFPYEWSFPALKAAALLHLEIHLAALEHGITLVDASAYNVQFRGARPVFIDHLSFRKYRPGEVWIGHRQFCEQFLNPLLLRALFGVTHNAWYRGAQEGISSLELARLLRRRHYLSWNLLAHVGLQSYFQRTAGNVANLAKETVPTSALPLAALRRMLGKLHAWIEKLEPKDTGKTVWEDYARSHSYTSEEVERKKRFVSDFVTRTKPRLLWDLGCNTGDYSLCALNAGLEYAIGFDFDQGALEAAFARAASKNLPLQTVFLDAANPAPNQGWQQHERPGLRARASADALLALAFVHHLAIGRNIPLDRLVEWIVDLAPRGIVEFVPKNDPMVKALLRLREDIFPNYTKESFLSEVERRARIVRNEIVSSSGRMVVEYDRTAH